MLISVSSVCVHYESYELQWLNEEFLDYLSDWEESVEAREE